MRSRSPIYDSKKSTFLNSRDEHYSIFKGKAESKKILIFVLADATAEPLLEKAELDATACQREDFSEVFQFLDNLSKLPFNWDGYNAETPNIKAIEQTKYFFLFFQKITSFFPKAFAKPNITANSEGDVVLEWWFGEKKLTLYISSEQISYIKVTGERIEDMEDGNILISGDNRELVNLFSWLTR